MQEVRSPFHKRIVDENQCLLINLHVKYYDSESSLLWKVSSINYLTTKIHSSKNVTYQFNILNHIWLDKCRNRVSVLTLWGCG